MIAEIQAGKQLRSVTQSTSALNAQPSDPRGNLLAEIQAGKKLKPVSNANEAPKMKLVEPVPIHLPATTSSLQKEILTPNLTVINSPYKNVSHFIYGDVFECASKEFFFQSSFEISEISIMFLRFFRVV